MKVERPVFRALFFIQQRPEKCSFLGFYFLDHLNLGALVTALHSFETGENTVKRGKNLRFARLHFDLPDHLKDNGSSSYQT